MDWFFSSIVKLWGQLICDANLLAQAGKTLSWPSSWKRGKGESKIIWTWRLKVSFTATSSSSQRQTFFIPSLASFQPCGTDKPLAGVVSK